MKVWVREAGAGRNPLRDVRVRFEVSDLLAGSVVEAALDAFVATAYHCAAPLAITTPALPPANLGQPYSFQLEAENGFGQLVWSDKLGNLDGSGLALSSDGLLWGTPLHSGTLSFIADVNDEFSHVDERAFDLNVQTCCIGRVGNANADGEYPDEVTLGDIMLLVDVKFVSGNCAQLLCLPEADVNQDGGATPSCEDHVTLGDIMSLVDFLFITGPENAVLPDCL